MTSRPATESRHCSTQGSALKVTTTTETSATVGQRRAPIEHVLPEDHQQPRQREHERHHEEEEPARERGVCADAELAEEADEKRLAHTEAVDRERHEHDQEE